MTTPAFSRPGSRLGHGRLRSALAGCAALAWGGAAWAEDYTDRVGTAEFQYLDILVYARPAGLAGAYTSLAQGEDAIGFNPAGISKVDAHRSISATLRYHFTEVSSGNFTYAYPGSGSMRYAFAAAYVNYGRIESLDEEGNALGGNLMPASFNPSLSAARKLGDRVRLGATLKGVSEYLGDFEGSLVGYGWAVDAGLLYQPAARNLGFGVSLLNLGTKLGSQWEGGETGGLLPVALKAGFYYHPLDLPKGRLAVDAEIPWHDAPMLIGGMEYAMNPALMLRMGSRITFDEAKHLFLQATDQRPGDFEGGHALKLAGGFTFQVEGVGLDYAAQYWLGLSWVHALTLRYAVM